VILAWDMGAGKTGAVLTAIVDLFEHRKIRKVLIVAPMLVAQTTWPDEIEEWEHTTHLTYTILRVEDEETRIKQEEDMNYIIARKRGMSVDDARSWAATRTTETKMRWRKELADSDAQLHIINREGLPWLWAHFRNGKDWPYDLLVIDEASMLKSGSKHVKRGKREKGKVKTKAQLSQFGIIAKAREYTYSIIEMTGTPTPNGLRNLWGLTYCVDLGERLGTARTAFEERWFTQNRYNYKWKPTASAEREITERVKDIMFALDPKDYAELPPMVSVPVPVTLSKDVLAEYKKLERDNVSELYDVEAVNGGVLHNKLLQYANGSLYREDGSDVWVHDEKLYALEHIVEELDGEPLLVAYSYDFDKARIRKRFPKAVVLNETDARKTKAKWNAGEIPMLLAHPMSAAHGLNLQYGGHHLVWYGLNSDLELYMQFNKRLHRPGQTKPVFNHIIIAKGTRDEAIIPVYLDPKGATQERIMAAVRANIRNR